MREFFKGFFGDGSKDEEGKKDEKKGKEELPKDGLSRRDFLRGGRAKKEPSKDRLLQNAVGPVLEDDYYADYVVEESAPSTEGPSVLGKSSGNKLSRRTILKVLGAELVGGLVLGKIVKDKAFLIDEFLQSRELKSRHDDFLESTEDGELKNNEAVKAYERLLHVLEDARQYLLADSAKYQGAEGVGKLRLDFLQKYGKEVEKFFTSLQTQINSDENKGRDNLEIFNSKDKGVIGKILKDAYGQLAEFKVHGRVYAFLHANGVYGKKDEVLEKQDIGMMHFEVRVQDFLPSGSELTGEDIEPSNHYINKVLPYRKISSNKGAVDFLREKSSDLFWNKELKKGKEKSRYLDKVEQYLNNNKVKASLRAEPDLTLAGAVSLAKGYARNMSEPQLSLLPFDVAEASEKILEERHKFEQQTILGPDTTLLSVQGLLGDDFIQDGANVIANRTKLTDLGIKSKAKEHKDYTALASDSFKKILKDIEESSGPTTVIFHTHGEGRGIVNISENLLWDQIADAFERRFEKYFTKYGSGAYQEAFKNVFIMPLSCKANDLVFTSGLRQKIAKKMIVMRSDLKKEDSNISPEKFVLPRAISLTSPGAALTGETADIFFKLVNETLDQKGTFDGRDMLSLVEPALCTNGADVSISGTSGSTLYEISQNRLPGQNDEMIGLEKEIA